jgi:hypothetical protein
VDALNAFYSSAAGVLFNKDQTTLIQCPGGKAGSYTMPDSVTNIWHDAFDDCASLTSVMIGNNVTSIGYDAFYGCTGLTNVTIGSSVRSIGGQAFSECHSLTSVNIPDSVTSIGNLAFYRCMSLTSVTLPDNITSIGSYTFYACARLTSISIPAGVSSIGDRAFEYCADLTGVYFQANAPSLGLSVFVGANKATVYYLPGTTGWGPTFGGRPTALWNPQVSNTSFSVHANQFGFTITGTSNMVVVVQACTDLVDPVWTPLETNVLTGGSSYFSDTQSTNYPVRFYSLRAP